MSAWRATLSANAIKRNVANWTLVNARVFEELRQRAVLEAVCAAVLASEAVLTGTSAESARVVCGCKHAWRAALQTFIRLKQSERVCLSTIDALIVVTCDTSIVTSLARLVASLAMF